MVVYFSIYCFLGFIMESIYISLLKRKWIASGLLKGPFIPLYGFGATILICIFSFLHCNIFFTCLIGGLAMTALEYFTSLYIEKVFHCECWNYSHHHFQIHGRICLFYTIMWSILSGFLIFTIHPFIIQLHMMNDFMTILSLIYLSFLLKAFINKIQFTKRNGLDIH